MSLVVSLTVVSEDQNEAALAAEVMARAAIGLALEGTVEDDREAEPPSA
jgi:hypothetical protein